MGWFLSRREKASRPDDRAADDAVGPRDAPDLSDESFADRIRAVLAET